MADYYQGESLFSCIDEEKEGRQLLVDEMEVTLKAEEALPPAYASAVLLLCVKFYCDESEPARRYRFSHTKNKFVIVVIQREEKALDTWFTCYRFKVVKKWPIMPPFS